MRLASFSSRRRGYTLVEVLVAAVIVVIITTFSTALLMNTAKSQQEQVQIQMVTDQVQRAMREIAEDMRRSLKTQIIELTDTASSTAGYSSTLNTVFSLNNYPVDDLLLLQLPLMNGDGSYSSAGVEYHAYCAETQLNSAVPPVIVGKRLVRYVVRGGDLTVRSLPKKCQLGSVMAVFGMDRSDRPAYLTDGGILIKNLRFWPVWLQSATGGTQDAPGLNMEATAQYFAGNIPNSSVDLRTNVGMQSQLVFRSFASRSSEVTRIP